MDLMSLFDMRQYVRLITLDALGRNSVKGCFCAHLDILNDWENMFINSTLGVDGKVDQDLLGRFKALYRSFLDSFKAFHRSTFDMFQSIDSSLLDILKAFYSSLLDILKAFYSSFLEAFQSRLDLFVH